MTGWSLEDEKWLRFSVIEVSISLRVTEVVLLDRILCLQLSSSRRINPMMSGLGRDMFLLSEFASFSTDGSSRNDMVFV